MRSWPDERDVLPSGAATDLPLWQQAAPSTGTEQRQLADERWVRWSVTADGRRVLAWIESEALAAHAAGAKRIGVKDLVEDARKALRRSINNSVTGWIGLWLVGRHPALGDVIELRQRK